MNQTPPTVRRLLLDAIAADPEQRSQAAIADCAGMSAKHLSQVIQGHARLGPGIAVKLDEVLGVPAEVLLIAQALADAAAARALKEHKT